MPRALLDTLGHPVYHTVEYMQSTRKHLSATKTWRSKIELPAEQVFKTLALYACTAGEHVFAVDARQYRSWICGSLRQLQQARSGQSSRALKEVEPLTGYVRGGVTAHCSASERLR